MAKKITLKELLSAENVDELIEKLSFEDGLQLMEELVEKVESGSFALEDSLQAYERGVSLLAKLRGVLEAAEEKLEVLQGKG